MIRSFGSLSHGPVRLAKMQVSWPGGGKVMQVFAFEVDGLLIDTGLSRMEAPFMNWLAQSPPSQLVLTHHHEDHSGNAAAVLNKWQIPGFAHPETVQYMQQGFALHPYRMLLFGQPQSCSLENLGVQVETPHHTFDVYPTTGHSSDHICLHEPEAGWLFSGDLYLGRKVQVGKKEESIPLQIASLDKLLLLDFDTLFCSHLPRFKEGKAYLQEKRDFLVSSSEMILDLHSRGLSVQAIRHRMHWPEKWLWRAVTLNDVSAVHLIQSVITGQQNGHSVPFP